MKKTLIIGGLFVAGLVSCSKDKLTLYPYNQIETTQAFNTESDVSFAVNGMYNGLRNLYVGGIWNIAADVLSDNLIQNAAGRGTLTQLSQWTYTTDPFGTFGTSFNTIRRANAILENIEKFPESAFKSNAKGQALAVRGLSYFDLSRVYSRTYLNATIADSTVPYVTTTDYSIMPSKEPLTGFYDKVIADLELAKTLIASTNGVGKLDKASVSGLLSRVYLYKGDWAKCITSANEALGGSPNLPTIANFPGIWTDATEAGVLFKVRNTTTDNINSLGVNYYQFVDGGFKSEFNVEYNLNALYTTTDVRKAAYINTSAYLGLTYNHVYKYNARAAAGSVRGVVDAKVLRTAEVLLNRAEAYFRSTPANETAALADLVLLKTNRYTGYVPEVLSGQALLNEIYLQRRLELAFEGDRFFDLKRRNLPVQRDGTKGDRADGTGVNYVFTTLPAASPKFLMPFPLSEINFNSNLKQNPGY